MRFLSELRRSFFSLIIKGDLQAYGLAGSDI